MRRLLDILLHRVPWRGDKIRIYSGAMSELEFVGEFPVEIRDGEVWTSYHGYIRRDVPQWKKRFGAWEYRYD